MALHPEEFITPTDHGSMKLRAAVLRAMTLLPKERKRTTIVRDRESAILTFEQNLLNLADAIAARYFLQGPNAARADKSGGLA